MGFTIVVGVRGVELLITQNEIGQINYSVVYSNKALFSRVS